MQIGVVFPQVEIGADPVAVRDYAQAAEAAGYDHLLAFDHVIGANAASRPGWSGAYSHVDMFHEVLVLLGYLAGATERIGLMTGVLILAQRQTVLVAKQAAAADVLSGGRLRLGVGIGWNDVEYEALGENFGDRGRRSEEQIELMRTLWTQDLVTFEGRWHTITDAGLNPLPVQRPIPIWLGGYVEPVLRRIARLGDGWLIGGGKSRSHEQCRAMIEKMHAFAREAGRDPGEIAIESWVNIGEGGPDHWAAEIDRWKALGATYMSVNTMGAGLESPKAHMDAIRRFKEAVGNP